MKSTRTHRARARAHGYGALRIPGLSLLDLQIIAWGLVLVRSPACGLSRTVTVLPGVITEETFPHAPDCSIGQRIETVLRAVRAAEAAEAN